MDYRDIIKAPIITEKTAGLEQENTYVFSVDVKANKTQIKQAIENIFNVKVENVNTINVKPKKKRVLPIVISLALFVISSPLYLKLQPFLEFSVLTC